jgi:hypothetical protein
VKFTLRKEGERRGWPRYLFWGRMRTSTFALIVAFFLTSWVHQHYQPPAPAPAQEPAQVVPPGFVPDPEYTWVPRTNVQERPKYTTSTTTTEPTPTESESPTTPTSPTDTAPTTVVDPDGPGPLSATTLTPTTSTSPLLPVPNRSGTPTTGPTTSVIPGPGPVTTTPLAPG